METRPLGKTDINLPILSFGASSLGAEFRSVNINEVMKSTITALDLGMNFIDTSPFYGRGMSEVMLGQGLKGIPRENYLLGTKLGRYSDIHFDFSAKRVEESIHISLHRLGTNNLDVLLMHDVEFVNLAQIWEETWPAMVRAKEQGKVRAIGFSCYPMKTFNIVLDHIEDTCDCVLSYNQHTLQNTAFTENLLPRLNEKKIGAINCVKIQKKNKGINTDWIGYLNSIKKYKINKSQKIIVLGYGGASKAIVYGLFFKGFKNVLVFNRAKKLIKLKEKKLFTKQYSVIERHFDKVSLIINTTPVNPLSKKQIKKVSTSTVVSDIVYNPKNTNFLNSFKSNK